MFRRTPSFLALILLGAFLFAAVALAVDYKRPFCHSEPSKESLISLKKRDSSLRSFQNDNAPSSWQGELNSSQIFLKGNSLFPVYSPQQA